MLCKTYHSCAFLSWIALGKDLPVNFASINGLLCLLVLLWWHFWLQSSEDFLCRQILRVGPKAISGSCCTPG